MRNRNLLLIILGLVSIIIFVCCACLGISLLVNPSSENSRTESQATQEIRLASTVAALPIETPLQEAVIPTEEPTQTPAAEPTATLVPTPISEPTNTSEPIINDCEKAMKMAAEVSDMQDTVEDIDPAIRVCESMDEFKVASLKFPEALDGVDEEIFVTNRCTYNPSLHDTAICKAINTPAVPVESTATTESLAPDDPTATSLPPAPVSEVPIEIISLTSPIAPNSNAEAIIQTEPNAKCSIYVIYKSGASEADGLEDKVAGSDGRCSWQWHIGGKTSPGQWDIEFSVFSNGRNAQLHADFVVTP